VCHTIQTGPSTWESIAREHPWDKEQGAAAAPVPTVTGDLGLRGGTPCPVQAGAIFHLAAQVR